MKAKEVARKHDKLRNILQDYGCEEYGDCIVDEISELFDFPTTIENEKQEAIEDILEVLESGNTPNLEWIKARLKVALES